MTLRHNTVSRVEPRELRPAPGSFLNPIERVTYRLSRTPSFAQPIDANRYFDGPSLQPEGRRSGGLTHRAVILLAAVPCGFFGVLFGLRYGIESQEVGSTLIASSVLSIVTLTAVLVLTAGI